MDSYQIAKFHLSMMNWMSFDREKSHTVTFKCIGANRDSSQQNALRVAAENIRTGLNIPVRLNPQPDNPADSNAIAFQCFVQQKWQRVGYVVCEVLPYVHDAMRDVILWWSLVGLSIMLEPMWTRFLCRN